MRSVYVISDLHLGGVYGENENDRGFRICTHVPELAAFVQALAKKPDKVELVINGDLVDFLAERHEEAPHWRPFLGDPTLAADRLSTIIERDIAFFDALKALLAAGHRLVITLGNHDIELSLPEVRARLRKHIDAGPDKDFQFIYDGEAYIVGDALIEHGNRYDKFNHVNYNGLRQLRSLQSRRQPVAKKWELTPPPGSFMVADVMNPIKGEYKFVDLLKPEQASVIPILLALEPGYRKRIGKAVKALAPAAKFKLDSAAKPGIGDDISSDGGGGMMMDEFGGDISSAPQEDDLDKVLKETMGDNAAGFLDDVDEGPSIGEDISAMDTIDRTLGFLSLLVSKDDGRVNKRLPSLLKALRALQDDQTFDPQVETDPVYLDAARELTNEGGFKYVTFGHTHLAKRIELDDGAVYLNSGTWADLMQFPKEILSGGKEEALDKLGEFVADLQTSNLNSWIRFRPTYVRFDIGDDDKVVSADFYEYSDPAEV